MGFDGKNATSFACKQSAVLSYANEVLWNFFSKMTLKLEK